VSRKIADIQPVCRISYRFHFRMRSWLTIYDHPAWCLGNDIPRHTNYHGTIGLITCFDSEVAHLKRPSNEYRWGRFFGLFNVA
jgi:hypothetical protein